MAKAIERYNKRAKAQQVLKDISEKPHEYLIIHYSCESFYGLPQGNTPRITSIAIRRVRNAQTISFSIHKVAELKGIKPEEITKYYNELEKQMLDDYFQFVSENQTTKWIHINMRNVNYGFEAIKHRYRVLGGEPKIINDDMKIDLARLFVDVYGRQYAPHPRFESLYRLNKITMTSFLNGEKEAAAFNKGEYVALHQSTLRKVDNMHNVLSLAIERDLKTNGNLFQVYGVTPAGVFYAAKDNWIVALTLFVLGVVLATLITLGISSIFPKERNYPDQKQNSEIEKNDGKGSNSILFTVLTSLK